jgi:hypothetical protein
MKCFGRKTKLLYHFLWPGHDIWCTNLKLSIRVKNSWKIDLGSLNCLRACVYVHSCKLFALNPRDNILIGRKRSVFNVFNCVANLHSFKR